MRAIYRQLFVQITLSLFINFYPFLGIAIQHVEPDVSLTPLAKTTTFKTKISTFSFANVFIMWELPTSHVNHKGKITWQVGHKHTSGFAFTNIKYVKRGRIGDVRPSSIHTNDSNGRYLRQKFQTPILTVNCKCV
ncbi:hypothetical protein YC2023_105080 [Brassica napus]